MIYYPLTTLMLAGIREVLVISTPQDTAAVRADARRRRAWGMHIEYAVQPTPDGLAQAFIIGERFIAATPCALVLGDNLFFGSGFRGCCSDGGRRRDGRDGLRLSRRDPGSATAWSTFDARRSATRIEEKPRAAEEPTTPSPVSTSTTATSSTSPRLKPSARGELEITDVNRAISSAAAGRAR